MYLYIYLHKYEHIYIYINIYIVMWLENQSGVQFRGFLEHVFTRQVLLKALLGGTTFRMTAAEVAG